MKVDPTIDPDFDEVSSGLQMRITQTIDGHFSLVWMKERGGPKSFVRGLTYGEMLENVIKIMAAPGVKLPGRAFEDQPHQLIKWGQVPSGYAAVMMPKAEAEELSYSLSDLLCWHGGYAAATPEDQSHRLPMGVEAARSLNIKLKSAIEKVKE